MFSGWKLGIEMTVTGVLTLTTSEFGNPAGDGVCGCSESVAQQHTSMHRANVGILTGGSQEVLEMYLDPSESRRPHGIQ